MALALCILARPTGRRGARRLQDLLVAADCTPRLDLGDPALLPSALFHTGGRKPQGNGSRDPKHHSLETHARTKTVVFALSLSIRTVLEALVSLWRPQLWGEFVACLNPAAGRLLEVCDMGHCHLTGFTESWTRSHEDGLPWRLGREEIVSRQLGPSEHQQLGALSHVARACISYPRDFLHCLHSGSLGLILGIL